MKRYGLITAILLLAAVNALVLANAAYNRSSEFESEVSLTERELPVHYSWSPSRKENTGLSLRLNWQVYDAGMTAKGERYRTHHISWFDQAKLESLGFDCSRLLSSENAELYYKKMLPRKTFAVLEYEGKTWQEWQNDHEQRIEEMEEEVARGEETKKNLEDFKKEYQSSLIAKSRLFVVDVGNNAFLLRRKYPDRSRFIITPAKVSLSYQPKNADGAKPAIDRLNGVINEILIEEINVPLEKRGDLDRILTEKRGKEHGTFTPYHYYSQQQPPAYIVRVRYGKKYEPWIEDAQKIAAQRSPATEGK